MKDFISVLLLQATFPYLCDKFTLSLDIYHRQRHEVRVDKYQGINNGLTSFLTDLFSQSVLNKTDEKLYGNNYSSFCKGTSYNILRSSKPWIVHGVTRFIRTMLIIAGTPCSITRATRILKALAEKAEHPRQTAHYQRLMS